MKQAQIINGQICRLISILAETWFRWIRQCFSRRWRNFVSNGIYQQNFVFYSNLISGNVWFKSLRAMSSTYLHIISCLFNICRLYWLLMVEIINFWHYIVLTNNLSRWSAHIVMVNWVPSRDYNYTLVLLLLLTLVSDMFNELP